MVKLATLRTRLDTAARQLLDLGLTSFAVHGADHQASPARSSRPDRAAAMKESHSYDVWLKREVAQTRAAVASGDMPVLSDADMEARWKTKREEREQRQRQSRA